MIRFYNTFYVVLVIVFFGCKKSVKQTIKNIKPVVITEQTLNDTDDPAIWVNTKNPSKSIVFGTDKSSKGAIYAFDLEGKIIKEKVIKNLQRPNNIDVTYGVRLSDTIVTDIIAFTEREAQQLRFFSVPNMQPIDGGGLKVFADETDDKLKQPMGVAFYKKESTGQTFIIVGRKKGPKQGYLYQYEVVCNLGKVELQFVRKFGEFSGIKEIEAIAVDNELGYVYYADEGHSIRKYYADPKKGDKEVAFFGGDYFKRDIEGIAIVKTGLNAGVIIASNQQENNFNLFDRITNKFIKTVNLNTKETDGCEVTSVALSDKFSKGLFVAMNSDKTFYYYDLNLILN